MMNDSRKKIPAFFYREDNGSEPVREWLSGLTKTDRRLIGEDMKTVEYGWPIGMPVCRPMGKGLYEVRSHVTGSRIARVLFCIHQNQMVLLHGFIKKTQKTPKAELDTAEKRKRKLG